MPRHRTPPPHGFTLVELMVVVAILGGLLLLVPANLMGFGARSRLENAANTLVSALGGAREQAILDGYEARMEIGWFKDAAGRHAGYRWHFTNLPPPRPGGDLRRRDERDEETAKARTEERQWLYTAWHAFDEGIRLVGISQEAGRWQKIGDQEPFVVRFFPDGTVEQAVGVRIESEDLDVKRENRTMTVLLNGLTAEAWVVEGDGELPQKRDAREFS